MNTNHPDFSLYPKKIVIILRGHWVVILKHLGSLLIGWSLFALLLWFAFLARDVSIITSTVLIFIATVTLIISHHIFFVRIFEWLLSNVYITTEHVIDLHFLSFAEDDVAYIEVAKINEVEKRKHGFWRNVLNYGEVVLSVAGMPTNPIFKYVHHPSKVVASIEALLMHKQP